jgi:transcriptional regulator with XRE-family HTH domain
VEKESKMEESFGQYVRGLRERAGVKLNEFAKQLEISPAYWSRIENDREHPPKDDLISKAAELLKASKDELFIYARRLPPDMQGNVGEVVRLYRAKHKNK